MGAIDRWWNRHFPAHSYARLAFLMVAAPIIGIPVGLLRQAAGYDDFTLNRYLMVTIGMEVLVMFAWIVARMRRDEIDFEKENREFEARIFPWRRQPVPWELPKEETELPKEEPALSADPRVPEIVLEAPKKPRISALNDYALTLLVCFITFAIMMEFFFDIGTTADNLGWAAIGGFGMSLVVTFRYSPLIPVLLAIAIGYPAAVLPAMFFMFMGGGESIWEWWAVTSALAFVFVMPPWLALRRCRGRWERFRIPNWAFTTVVSILMLIGIGFSSMSVGSSQSFANEPPVTQQPTPVGAGVENFGTTSGENAALTLYYAWRNGDRNAATRVAGAWVVDDLFAKDFDSTARYLGCGLDEGFAERCVIRTSTEQILLAPSYPENNRYHVATIQRVGLDYAIDYSGASAEPTPTPSAT